MTFRLLPFFVSSFVLFVGAHAQHNDYGRISKSMEMFGAAFKEIQSAYIEETDPELIVSAGIKGMLDALDPYSTFVREDEESDFEFLTKGEYIGFGFSIAKRNGVLTISDIRPGFPAAEAGVRIGDCVVEIDGVRTDTMAVENLRSLTRGKVGQTSTFTLARIGRADTLRKQIARAAIPVQCVDVVERLEGNIGYIALTRFSRTAGRETREAYFELTRNGKLNGLILDLRGNLGGLLDAAISISEMFLPRNAVIVSTVDRLGNRKEYRSTADPINDSVPLVLLLDKRSASASEVVAGAIQDNDRGIVVGEQSFGKGLVQTVLPLPYDATVKLTTSRYYAPSGRCIQRNIRTDTTQTESQKFLTRLGRTVHAKAGIMPDSVVTEQNYPPVVQNLIQKNVIFTFATRYTATRLSLAPNFKADKALLEEFYRYLKSRPADEQSETLAELDSAKTLSLKSKASDASLRAFEVATKAAEKDWERDLRANSGLISILLEAEIECRFGSDTDRAKRVLAVDPVVSVGKNLLTTGKFSAILSNWSAEDQ